MADLKINLFPCAVKHEGDEGGQDSFRGGQADAELNDTLYGILDGKSKWFQFNIPIRVVKNGQHFHGTSICKGGFVLCMWGKLWSCIYTSMKNIFQKCRGM